MDRNPFNLRTPSAPVVHRPPEIVPDVKLTGITSDGTSSRAWFVIPVGPGHPKLRSFRLSKGEISDGFRVVAINVKILNKGTPVTLNFKEHGLPTPIQRGNRPYAGYFVPNTRPSACQSDASKLDQARVRLEQRDRFLGVRRQSNTNANLLPRMLPSFKENPSLPRLPQR